MTIAAVLGYLLCFIAAVGLIGFARIKGVIGKVVDLTEKTLDATLEGADLVKEVNSKLIAELKSGMKPAPKKTTKTTRRGKGKGGKPGNP